MPKYKPSEVEMHVEESKGQICSECPHKAKVIILPSMILCAEHYMELIDKDIKIRRSGQNFKIL
jgi:hypothetical protein